MLTASTSDGGWNLGHFLVLLSAALCHDTLSSIHLASPASIASTPRRSGDTISTWAGNFVAAIRSFAGECTTKKIRRKS